MSDESADLGSRSVFLGLYPLDAALVDPMAIRRSIADHPGVCGAEVPWIGLDETVALADRVLGDAPHWRLQLTGIPFTMRMQASAGWGLAGPEERMRGAAVDEAVRMAAAVRGIESSWGRGRVAAVTLHSAPRGGSADALRSSLRRLLAEDFGSAELVIEHVDAPQPGREPSKGFLPLVEEVAIAAELGVGIGVNWGRSAIELRDPDAVVQHLEAARDAGVLRSLAFSGVLDRSSAYGQAWADAHVPPSSAVRGSLLTPERIRSSIEVAGEVMLGAKFGYRGDDAGAVAMLGAALDAVGAGRGALTRG